MRTDPGHPSSPPPSPEERMLLAAMRSRWEALFRGTVDDDELDRVLRYLETPLSTPEGRAGAKRHLAPGRDASGPGPAGH